jgi:hypothetical protein
MNLKNKPLKPLSAAPVKSFFVNMLTRDIDLDDSILDLLDNCIDGILREGELKKDKPYEGFHAYIDFDDQEFTIEDNCGGIDFKLFDYAFRMGRLDSQQDEGLQTVGTYGIGMKRAIFKIGTACKIYTKNKEGNFVIPITPDWIKDESDWDLPVERTKDILSKRGTKLVIREINSNISKKFINKELFEKDLKEKVRKHYALIIQKGFEVKINGVKVQSKPIKILFEDVKRPNISKKLIRPYIYSATINNVHVFLSVGLTGPPPSSSELDSDQKEKRYNSEDAGWTIICNDRVVLANDKTRLTGWGEAGLPNYHTQFIAISGVVIFASNHARDLPLTTTKRGVDTSNEIWSAVKDRMRDGLRKFTKYTNDWKGREAESRVQLEKAEPIDINALQQIYKKVVHTDVKKGGRGKHYVPSLPAPKITKVNSRISFMEKTDDVEVVREYLFDETEMSANEVGKQCFKIMLKEATK